MAQAQRSLRSAAVGHEGMYVILLSVPLLLNGTACKPLTNLHIVLLGHCTHLHYSWSCRYLVCGGMGGGGGELFCCTEENVDGGGGCGGRGSGEGEGRWDKKGLFRDYPKKRYMHLHYY